MIILEDLKHKLV